MLSLPLQVLVLQELAVRTARAVQLGPQESSVLLNQGAVRGVSLSPACWLACWTAQRGVSLRQP